MSLPGIADATGGRISRKAPHARTSVAILAFDFIVSFWEHVQTLKRQLRVRQANVYLWTGALAGLSDGASPAPIMLPKKSDQPSRATSRRSNSPVLLLTTPR